MPQEEKKTWGKRESKIIVRLFLIVVAVLLLMNAWDAFSPNILGNGLPENEGGSCGLIYFRNRRIDKMKAEIKQSEKSDYTEAEINSAVNCVKATFKERDNNINLLSVSFDEEKSNAFRDGYHATEKFGKKNVIVLFCNYTIYESQGTSSKGTYENWAMILTRENSDKPWTVSDQGY
ncbi:MAG: DUF4829 domain-containing protein [Clostridia bacterium]|nr:DUF4829 domain-containing protein [Clostridia bacterium]